MQSVPTNGPHLAGRRIAGKPHTIGGIFIAGRVHQDREKAEATLS